MSKRTVREAGWHKSAYNLISKIPGTDKIGIANIYRGSFVVCTPGEVFLLSEIESLPEDHPIVEVFKKRGLIVNFDEREKLIGVSDPCYKNTFTAAGKLMSQNGATTTIRSASARVRAASRAHAGMIPAARCA